MAHCHAEGPDENSYNGGNKPGEALKLPVKHYEEATKVATPKGHVTVSGPCEDKSYGPLKKY